MRTSRIASLVAVGAISLPFLTSSTSAVAASPRAAPAIGTQLAELEGSDTVVGDWFGSSVAISGTTAVVGAVYHAKIAGRAYVFTRTGAGWKQVAELEGSDTAAGDGFGDAVGLAGTTIVVGAVGHAKSKFTGRAYVFTRTGAGWKQAAELEVSDTVAGDGFGWSVAISGTTIVVGASGHANGAGRAYVFTKTGAGWKQAAELEGSDTVEYGDYSGFGFRVAISGTTIVVGAGTAVGYGAVYVFTKTGSGWKQAARLEGSAYDCIDPLAISGTTIVVGAIYAVMAGRAYVFTRTGAGWKQAAELEGSDTVARDEFGAVAISGTTIVVGAPGHAKNAGRIYVFTKTGAGWKQVAELEGSDTVAGDGFGGPVAMSGTTAVVGAPDPKGAGRAYVFEV
jgi:hypothetical protein